MKRIVTREMLIEGFVIRFSPDDERRRFFTNVKKLSDGNYQVDEPELIAGSFVSGAAKECVIPE